MKFPKHFYCQKNPTINLLTRCISIGSMRIWVLNGQSKEKGEKYQKGANEKDENVNHKRNIIK